LTFNWPLCCQVDDADLMRLQVRAYEVGFEDIVVDIVGALRSDDAAAELREEARVRWSPLPSRA
jgi:hypothetical protein